jgi:hypothetical protein
MAIMFSIAIGIVYKHFEFEISSLRTEISQVRGDSWNTHHYLMAHIKGSDKE